jgi:hypothetical protein
MRQAPTDTSWRRCRRGGYQVLDVLKQNRRTEGFADEVQVCGQVVAARKRVRGVSGHEQDRKVGASVADPFGELRPDISGMMTSVSMPSMCRTRMPTISIASLGLAAYST